MLREGVSYGETSTAPRPTFIRNTTESLVTRKLC